MLSVPGTCRSGGGTLASQAAIRRGNGEHRALSCRVEDVRICRESCVRTSRVVTSLSCPRVGCPGRPSRRRDRAKLRPRPCGDVQRRTDVAVMPADERLFPAVGIMRGMPTAAGTCSRPLDLTLKSAPWERPCWHCRHGGVLLLTVAKAADSLLLKRGYSSAQPAKKSNSREVRNADRCHGCTRP